MANETSQTNVRSANITNQPSMVEVNLSDLAAQINNQAGDSRSAGSVIEGGYLDVLNAEGLGVYEMWDNLQNAVLNGEYVYFRKSGLTLGGNLHDIFANNFYSDFNSDIVEVKLDQRYGIRLQFDQSMLTMLWQTYKGQDLSNQLTNLTYRNTQKTFIARFDSEYLTMLNENTAGQEIEFDADGLLAAVATNPDALWGNILGLNIQILSALNTLETSLSSFRLGTNIGQYIGISYPFLYGILDLWERGYGSGTQSQNKDLRNVINARNIFGVSMKKHPFLNQLVNTMAIPNLAAIDRDATIFDISNTYDFSGTLAIIAHRETARIIFRYLYVQAKVSPTTGNLIFLVRADYGKKLLRPDLMLKIIQTPPVPPTVLNVSETQANRLLTSDQLARFVANKLQKPSLGCYVTKFSEGSKYGSVLPGATIEAELKDAKKAYKVVITVPNKGGK